jgi:hypothetical protein
MMPKALLRTLAHTRGPGNALSFWVRNRWRASRGLPDLPHEEKTHLFAHLDSPAALVAQAEADKLALRYRLEPLAAHSTAALYRKNLYLLRLMDQGLQGLQGLWSLKSPSETRALPPLDPSEPTAPSAPLNPPPLRALDVGAQDWHYVFALQRWLRYGGSNTRQVELIGIEVDPYERYGLSHTRRDYALAYARQTAQEGITEESHDHLHPANPIPDYRAGNVLDHRAEPYDLITWFFPLVTRYETLLWGLPSRFFTPERMVSHLLGLTRSGGHIIVLTHTRREHDLASRYLGATQGLTLIREAPAYNDWLEFHPLVRDRWLSVWRKA